MCELKSTTEFYKRKPTTRILCKNLLMKAKCKTLGKLTSKPMTQILICGVKCVILRNYLTGGKLIQKRISRLYVFSHASTESLHQQTCDPLLMSFQQRIILLLCHTPFIITLFNLFHPIGHHHYSEMPKQSSVWS